MGDYGFAKRQDEAEKDQKVIDWLCDQLSNSKG